jgi:hypothetical protein
MQDYFSHGFAACQHLERVRGLREWKGAIDMARKCLNEIKISPKSTE